MTKEKENKISRESAEGQIKGFCDFYDLDVEAMTDAMRGAHEEACNRLVRHIIKGRLQFEGSKVTQTTKDEKTLVYGVLKGKHKVEMAKCGSEDTAVKIYALCASLTGLHPTGIHKFEGVDLSVVECLGMLFLQV